MSAKDELNKFFLRHNLSKNDNYIISFSGGADSLGALITFKEIGCNNLSAVYVNHNIREKTELEREIKLNTLNCKKLNVPLKVEVIKTGEIEKKARCENIGIEAAAREIRYKILQDYLSKPNTYLVTAHNSNDCDEGDIIRFFRGDINPHSGGIIEKKGNIIRPFLRVGHSEFISICSECNLEYSIDSTNNECVALRNKVRNQLVPIAKNVFQGFEKTFLNTRSFVNMDIIFDSKKFIRRIANLKIFYVDRNLFSAISCENSKQIVFDIYNLLGINSRLPNKVVEKIILMAQGSNNFEVAYKSFISDSSRNRIYFYLDEEKERRESIFFDIKKPFKIQKCDLANFDENNYKNILALPLNSSFALVKDMGNKKLFFANYSKKTFDLLKDEKLSKIERDNCVYAICDDEILALIFYSGDIRVRKTIFCKNYANNDLHLLYTIIGRE